MLAQSECVRAICKSEVFLPRSTFLPPFPHTCAHTGGLSENDFILASKIDAVSIEDLQRKKKVVS